ncbi:MAG: helicase-related protein [Sulfurospirillaceae bacterium]|nr:helicase-related protein [Sulfurospirillaceae bacterium]MDD2827174.1 helicase-related protein [Sulfurospirillaceae bacterium]
MPEQTNKPITKKYYDNISIAKRTKQVAYFVEQHDKTAMFEQFIKNSGQKRIVVLTKSKRTADEISKYLTSKGILATAIHGNHRVEQKEEASKAFNAAKIHVLMTTDMILKTLNLTKIEVIVNYDLPQNPEEYFVRLKHVDEVGEAISFVSKDDKNALGAIELMMKHEMLQEKLKDFSPTPAPQTLGQKSKEQKKKPQRTKK